MNGTKRKELYFHYVLACASTGRWPTKQGFRKVKRAYKRLRRPAPGPRVYKGVFHRRSPQ